jgi:hypothetical protein
VREGAERKRERGRQRRSGVDLEIEGEWERGREGGMKEEERRKEEARKEEGRSKEGRDR